MSDDFESIIEGLEIEEPDDVVNVQELSTEELINYKIRLEKELFEREEALNPKTQRGRDAHSLRNAVNLELDRRYGS